MQSPGGGDVVGTSLDAGTAKTQRRTVAASAPVERRGPDLDRVGRDRIGCRDDGQTDAGVLTIPAGQFRDGDRGVVGSLRLQCGEGRVAPSAVDRVGPVGGDQVGRFTQRRFGLSDRSPDTDGLGDIAEDFDGDPSCRSVRPFS